MTIGTAAAAYLWLLLADCLGGGYFNYLIILSRFIEKTERKKEKTSISLAVLLTNPKLSMKGEIWTGGVGGGDGGFQAKNKNHHHN